VDGSFLTLMTSEYGRTFAVTPVKARPSAARRFPDVHPFSPGADAQDLSWSPVP
jgi:hypothetical protein